MFRGLYSSIHAKEHIDFIITNVASAKKTSSSPILKQLTEELNESYLAIKNIKEHLEEI